MYFFNVHVIRNVLKRPWRKIYIPISAFSFILFSPAFVLIFCFLPQKTYFGFWEHKWEKSFLIVHALTDIFLDDLELKLINVQFYISHLYIVHFYQCSTTSIFALLENFRRSHDYSLTYHHIEFHTQTLSTVTVILTG